jgi:tetratricopeptide (TPR) repeat protein
VPYALLSLSVIMACGAGEPRLDTPVVAQASKPLRLPDLSDIAPSVHEQITAQHARALTPAAGSGSPGDEAGLLGKMLMAAEFNDAAAIAFEHARRASPQDPRWPYYLGHLSRNAGDLDAAARLFRAALALHPEDEPTLVWLGDTYFDSGRHAEAEPFFEKAVQARADCVAALVGLGRIALAREDFARAATNLESAIARDDRRSTAHYHLAMAYRGLGQTSKAESHLALASTTEIGPRDPLLDELNGILESGKAYQFRGLRSLDAGRFADAADYFRKGLALEPDSPWLHHGLGTALFQMQDPAGALKHFNASVRTSPSFARGHYSAGIVLAFTGRRAEAFERFTAATTADPQHVEAHIAAADVLRETGRSAQAHRLYEHTLTIDSRAAAAHFGMAMSLVQMGRHREARDRLSDGAARFPTQPEFTQALARLLAASSDDAVRDGARALSLMPKLLELGPRLDIAETMAMVLAENGKAFEATSYQREAIAAAAREGQTELANRMQSALRTYEAGRPSRTPWRDGEHPWLTQH